MIECELSLKALQEPCSACAEKAAVNMSYYIYISDTKEYLIFLFSLFWWAANWFLDTC